MTPVMLQSRVLGCETVAVKVPWGSAGKDRGVSPGGRNIVVGNPRVAGCQKQ